MHLISKRSHQLIEPPPSYGLGGAQTTTVRLGEVLLADLNSYLADRQAHGFAINASNVIRNALCLYLESAAHPDRVDIVGTDVARDLLPNPAHRPPSLDYSNGQTLGQYQVKIDGGSQSQPEGTLRYGRPPATPPSTPPSTPSEQAAPPPATEGKRRKAASV